MSGHSKWNNIKRRKGAEDAKRAKIFTKIGREIQVAVRAGGPDPATNNKLSDVVAKAKAANMPNDNIQRSIKRAAGGGEGENYEDVQYEGYGAGGVAVLVKALTDNRNRTAAEVRHAFDKFGGNLGTTGCVAFMFNNKGQLVLERDQYSDADAVMLDAIEAGAEDVEEDENVFVVTTAPENYSAVMKNLSDKGYQFAEAVLEPVPDNYIEVSDPAQREQLETLIDTLEDNDDVQGVYHNWTVEE